MRASVFLRQTKMRSLVCALNPTAHKQAAHVQHGLSKLDLSPSVPAVFSSDGSSLTWGSFEGFLVEAIFLLTF